MAQKKVTIIECDRCHEIVDPDIFKTEGGMVTTIKNSSSRRHQQFDLCPSCRVLHDRFLEMKPVDN